MCTKAAKTVRTSCLKPPLLLSFPCSNTSRWHDRVLQAYSTRFSANDIDRAQLDCRPRQVASVALSSGHLDRESREDSTSLCEYVCMYILCCIAFCFLSFACFVFTAWSSPQLMKYPAPVTILHFCIEYPGGGGHAIHLSCCIMLFPHVFFFSVLRISTLKLSFNIFCLWFASPCSGLVF